MKLPLKRLLAHTLLSPGRVDYPTHTRQNALVQTSEPLIVSSFQPAAKKPWKCTSVLD